MSEAVPRPGAVMDVVVDAAEALAREALVAPPQCDCGEVDRGAIVQLLKCADNVIALAGMVRERDKLVAQLKEKLRRHAFLRGSCRECLGLDGAHAADCALGPLIG